MTDINFDSFRHQGGQHSTWERTAHYHKQERPMRPVRKIVIRGAVDVVFIQSPRTELVVATETPQAMHSIKTRFEADTLIIEQERARFSARGGTINVCGSGNIVAGGDFYEGGHKRSGISDADALMGDCVIGVVMPEAPSIYIVGSGNATLHNLQQPQLHLRIVGSGDIDAYGQVGHLVAEIAGSGDIDTSDLLALTATLAVAGSGDIDASVTQSVTARISGSGDIAVRGNPPVRYRSVAGSGDIKFKKK